MEEKNEIVNRIAASTLVTLDLNLYYPEGELVVFDLKHNLYQEMILREKDFREFLTKHDWTEFVGKNVAITCSVDAIVPVWAYMLVAAKISPYAKNFVFGDLEMLETVLWKDSLSTIDLKEFEGAKIVIKGCGHKEVPSCAFVEATKILQPHVVSIMYGEPCSTVPVYKRGSAKANR